MTERPDSITWWMDNRAPVDVVAYIEELEAKATAPGAPVEPEDTPDHVVKLDQRQIAKWLDDLRNVLPIIPSRDGLMLARDERPLFTFHLNKAGGALSPEEAFAFAALLENMRPIVHASVTQQRDFYLCWQALGDMLHRKPSEKRMDEIRKQHVEADYMGKRG